MIASLGGEGIAGRKDLHGGRTLWSDSPRIRVRHRTVLKRERCDVAIVGAGISGAIIALMLAEIGQDVIVIDRRTPIHGSTLASTAMIQFELDTPLIELADKLGAAAGATLGNRPPRLRR
jgi:NADPH-dependent 2,4-dienoyl-CoA reductase/sulfur reductase-like enzyme